MIPYTWGDKVAMFSRTRGRGCALGTGAVRHVLGHQVGQDGAAGGTVGDAHVGRLEQVLLVQALHLVHMLGVEGAVRLNFLTLIHYQIHVPPILLDIFIFCISKYLISEETRCDIQIKLKTKIMISLG